MSCLELIDKCLFSLLLDGPGISTNDVWKQKKSKKSGHDTPHLVLGTISWNGPHDEKCIIILSSS